MMGKKQISVLNWTLSLLILLIAATFVTAKSFEPVFDYVERFKNGDDMELKVHVSKDSLVFLHSEKTEINQATYEQLLTEDAILQQIKVSSDEELMIDYEVGDLLRLEQTWINNQPKRWQKVEFIEIASYPLDQWLGFLKEAIYRGLDEYEVIEYEKEFFASLAFRQIDPEVLPFGRQQLSFSEEFFECMKFSREYKPRTTNTNKIVVLVHEPHWLLLGQYQLVPGLKAFTEANSKHRFRFLVEGYWENEIKYIPTKDLLASFSENVSSTSQVYSLLRSYRIDGALAYRLLYDHDLPALAIDNSKLIMETPREQKFKDSFEQQRVFTKIVEKLEKLPQYKSDEARMTLTMLGLFGRADTQDLSGQAVVDHTSQVAELYDELHRQLSSLDARSFKEECSYLKYQATCCHTQNEILSCALKRDATMAKNILDHFNSEHRHRIPLVFIGNFHTRAIIDRLPYDVAYVVIEPRLSPLFLAASERDRDNFNDALKLNTRPNYLRKSIGSLKLQVGPLKRELPYYESFLKAESLRIQLQKKAFISSSPLPLSLTSEIYNKLTDNGIFNNAQIGFAGGGEEPPSSFRGAFASFSFGAGRINPKLLFFDKERENWTRADRLNYLKKIRFIPPHEKLEKSVRKASFYQDKDSNRIFFFIFDPETQTFYLFDGSEGIDMYKLLVPPKKEGEEDATIHLRLSRQERMYYEVQETHG